MSEFKIEAATRSKALARMAFAGPAGSGKTTSALLMAKGMVEYMLEIGALSGGIRDKVGVIDTERRSSHLYAHLFPYDVIDLGDPYTADRYIGALEAFERAGRAVVIIDQGSHVWAGMGGLLEQVDAMKSRGGGDAGFSAWKDISPVYTAFIERLLSSPCHLFFNMRAKTHFAMEEYTDRHGNRKTKPVKIGMAPVMRAGIEYEFTSVLDLSVDGNVASSTKDRTGLFQGKTMRLDAEWGKKLAHWLLSGQEADAARDTTTPLQRAQALVGAGQRACERAKNKPDLEREFVSCREQLKALKDQLQEDEYQLLFMDLRSAAAARGAALTTAPTSPPPPDAISFDEALALEDWVGSAGLARDQVVENFEVPRLGHLSANRLQTVVSWVAAAAKRAGVPVPPLPAILAATVTVEQPRAAGPTPGGFDDLEDDLPFD